jgi:hypothetical protein
VKNESAGTATRDTLSASWTCQGPGIVEYQYQITQDSPQGVVVKGWTSVGQSEHAVADVPGLLPGKTYYWNVRAKSATGSWSDTGYSNGMLYASVDPREMHGAVYADLRAMMVFPNPYQPAGRDIRFGGQGVVFDQLPKDAEIKIFTLTGEEVIELHGLNDSGRVLWNACNAAGEEVASGVYVYLATGGGTKKIGKLAVLR